MAQKGGTMKKYSVLDHFLPSWFYQKTKVAVLCFLFVCLFCFLGGVMEMPSHEECDDLVLCTRVDSVQEAQSVGRVKSCSLNRVFILFQAALPTIVSQMAAARANCKSPPLAPTIAHLDILNISTLK